MKTLFYRKGEDTLRARSENGRFARAPAIAPAEGTICECGTLTLRTHGGPKVAKCAGCGRYFGIINGIHTPAACRICGGWTASGGMGHHAKTDKKVLGRRGCICSRKTRYRTAV